MDRLRYLSVALLSAIVVILAIQNLQEVEVNFLAWDFVVSVSLLALSAFLAGLVVGWIGTLVGRRPRPRRPAELGGGLEPGVVDVSQERIAEDVTEEIGAETPDEA